MAEVQNNTVTQNYLRGINLIRREAGTATDYYIFNAHGDVVNLVNTAGVVTQSYDYDAFGVEQDPDPLDTNHFRYCGEYLDAETGRYYLRARYYDPLIGRFTQRDTHWNTANMIYGDNPQKINEREDKLGLKTYSYAPQIMAIMQAGNLYVYGINNPVVFTDDTGTFICTVTSIFTGAAGGFLTALFKGDHLGYAAIAGAVGGAISGIFLDLAIVLTGGSAGWGAPAGIALAAVGSAIGTAVQCAVELSLNGKELDLNSILISAGISAAFSLVSFGLGRMVNNAFNLTIQGENILQELICVFRSAGVPDTTAAVILSTVFVELDKATVEAVINSTRQVK